MLGPLLLAASLLLLSLLILAFADWLARGLLYPKHQSVTRTPDDYGLSYVDVAFPSSDRLSLKGWWIPSEPAGDQSAPVVVLLHPMFGNRQGCGDTHGPWQGRCWPKVDLLKAAHHFHQAGYAVLLFDFRSHGESQGSLCAGGLTEDQDVVGAVDYAFSQVSSAAPRVGVVGFGLGAAAALAAIGRYKGGTETAWIFSGDSEGGSDWTEVRPANIKRLRFVIAVQPHSLGALVRDSLRNSFGPVGRLLLPLINQFSLWRGGFPLDTGVLLKFAACLTVPTLYVDSRTASQTTAQEVRALYNVTPVEKDVWEIQEPSDQAEAGEYVTAHLERVLEFAARACARVAVAP